MFSIMSPRMAEAPFRKDFGNYTPQIRPCQEEFLRPGTIGAPRDDFCVQRRFLRKFFEGKAEAGQWHLVQFYWKYLDGLPNCLLAEDALMA